MCAEETLTIRHWEYKQQYLLQSIRCRCISLNMLSFVALFFLYLQIVSISISYHHKSSDTIYILLTCIWNIEKMFKMLLSQYIDCYKYEMVCTVLSTSFFCYYGVLTLPLHHTFYLCLKKEKMVVTHYFTCPTADAGLPATKQFYTTINRLRKYTY